MQRRKGLNHKALRGDAFLWSDSLLDPPNLQSKVSHIKVLGLSMEGLYDISCRQMIRAKPEADQ